MGLDVQNSDPRNFQLFGIQGAELSQMNYSSPALKVLKYLFLSKVSRMENGMMAIIFCFMDNLPAIGYFLQGSIKVLTIFMLPTLL